MIEGLMDLDGRCWRRRRRKLDPFEALIVETSRRKMLVLER